MIEPYAHIQNAQVGIVNIGKRHTEHLYALIWL